jgi:hypothetical protein
LFLIYDVWKCAPTSSDGVNFAKDYQKDSYNKWIFIEKNKKFNYHQSLILLKMWNSKVLKIQRMFQNYFRILEFQESFTTYKWVIMYMIYEENL